MGEMRNACQIIIREAERKKPLRRYRLRWEDNIKMVIREIRWKVWTGCF
jgi:hypothetical protein